MDLENCHSGFLFWAEFISYSTRIVNLLELGIRHFSINKNNHKINRIPQTGCKWKEIYPFSCRWIEIYILIYWKQYFSFSGSYVFVFYSSLKFPAAYVLNGFFYFWIIYFPDFRISIYFFPMGFAIRILWITLEFLQLIF